MYDNNVISSDWPIAKAPVTKQGMGELIEEIVIKPTIGWFLIK